MWRLTVGIKWRGDEACLLQQHTLVWSSTAVCVTVLSRGTVVAALHLCIGVLSHETRCLVVYLAAGSRLRQGCGSTWVQQRILVLQHLCCATVAALQLVIATSPCVTHPAVSCAAWACGNDGQGVAAFAECAGTTEHFLERQGGLKTTTDGTAALSLRAVCSQSPLLHAPHLCCAVSRCLGALGSMLQVLACPLPSGRARLSVRALHSSQCLAG